MYSKIARGLLFLGVFSFLQACSVFAPQADKLAQAGGKLVTFYCNNVSDSSIRQQIRDAVNKYASPNSIRVDCANGGAPLVTGVAK